MARVKFEMKIFKNDKFDLKPKQIRAIELLINCEMAQKDIANECKVSERTLYNWIHHNDEFRNACEWYRKEVYKDFAPKAVETVVNLMINGESEKVRLEAAKDILARAGDDAVSKVDLESANKLDVHISVVDEVKE